jgi:hypothetical protein
LAHYLLKDTIGGIMGTISSATWVTRIVLGILLIAASAGALSAQTRDFTESRGTLAAAAIDELRRLETDNQQAVRIERRRNDSVLNGALIGAAAGVGAGLASCLTMEPWEICNNPGPLSIFAAVGAGIGIGIDALIREREVIYQPTGATELHVAPLAGRGTKGVQVGLRF